MAKKINEFAELSAPELTKKLGELKEELFNLRFRHAVNQLENTSKLKEVKKDIARVMTYLRQRELGGKS